jgi:hypothetical protein
LALRRGLRPSSRIRPAEEAGLRTYLGKEYDRGRLERYEAQLDAEFEASDDSPAPGSDRTPD